MKKRILAFILISVMCFSFSACGKDTTEETTETTAEETTSENEEETEVLDCTYDPNDYVTLGDYNGVEVTVDGTEYEYTDDGYNQYMNDDLSDVIGYVESDETTILEDSIVNVDYVGSQDGVAFDGGSAEDQMIDVANNSSTSGTSYITGFTSGLVGHSVGEEVAYEVTFPENYSSTDLAGQTVTFTFQVNYIAKAVDLDNVTDNQIADNFDDYQTVDDYKTGMKTEYENYLQDNLNDAIKSAVVNTVFSNATVDGYPENLVQARVDLYVNNMDSQLSATYGISYEDYITSYYGYDYDEFLENMKSSFAESVQQQMVFEVIAQKENLEIDQDEYDEYIAEQCANYNLTDTDSFLDSYTIGNLDGQEYFKTIYLANQAMQFCIDNAVVNY